jgi:two-component system response regulator HydG
MVNEQLPLKSKILLVDDDAGLIARVTELLQNDFDISMATNASDALGQLHASDFDLAVIDMRMPEVSGLELLRMIQGGKKPIPVVMLTTNDDPETIVSAMRFGASDYVVKNAKNLTATLSHRIGLALRNQELRNRAKKLETKISEQAKRYEIMGISPGIIKIKNQIAKLIDKRISINVV